MSHSTHTTPEEAGSTGLPAMGQAVGQETFYPRLLRLLQACVVQQASDMHLVPDRPPLIRAAGQLVPLPNEEPLTQQDIQGVLVSLRSCGDDRRLEQHGDFDGALTGAGARFRFNVFRRGGEACIALRRLDDNFRTLPELGMPESLYSLCDLPDGLIVVAGPTGAGKSTTLAALLDRINRYYSYHIITIEDPVEYIHRTAKSLVNQRQVGTDCSSFYDALVASLRQDPDVILIGEIRELNTIRTAITAAETGHLVFATVHAGDAVGVIERLVSVFPAGEQDGIRRQLSLVLRAVIVQQLMIADGPSSPVAANGRRRRVAASEVMMVNSAVANLIATGKSSQIYSSMEVGTSQGMQTFDQDLAGLVALGTVSEGTALTYAKNPGVFRDRLARIRANPSLARRGQGAGENRLRKVG